MVRSPAAPDPIPIRVSSRQCHREGDNDAEAFNRIQQHMEEKGEVKPDEANSDAKEKGEARQGEKQKESPRDGESASADGKADGKSGQKPQNSNAQKSPDENSKDRGEGKGAATRNDDAESKRGAEGRTTESRKVSGR